MANAAITDIDACVFDAYGTLFDFNAAAARFQAELGDKEAELSALWRRKQLEYTWLRSLMGRYVSFWQVTGDALDHSMAAVGIADASLRKKLLDVYWTLDAYPDATPTLRTLKQAGIRTAILSNGSKDMLQAAVDSAAMSDVLDAALSVDDVGIFKPHPSVYQLAVDALGVSAPNRICFMSSNAWDTNGAAAFGFRVVWVNRFGQVPERLEEGPEQTVRNLAALPALLGLSG